MKTYRLLIRQGDKFLGHFDASSPWAEEAVQAVSCILKRAGFATELQVATEERRLLESSPEGLRILASEPLFRSK